MVVSMWMARNVVTIEPATPITEAAAIMAQRHIRRLPVMEHHVSGPHPVGIITATDILHAYPPRVNPFAITASSVAQQIHVTAAEIMSHALKTVTPETPIEEAAKIMRDEKISTLLVVQKMKLAGLLTESDIFRAFVGILDFSRGDVRITFEIRKEENIFGFIAPIALRWGVEMVSLMSVEQGDRKLCVIGIKGTAVNKMLEELWTSGHPVLNIRRLP
jgi:acetoin utilization protein AcuB